MKISSIIVAGIAFAEAKKPKLSKSDFQDAKERGVSLEEEAMFEKCGGRPELPANAVGLKCKMWKGYTERAGKMEYSFIGCEPVCPAGWRPDQTGCGRKVPSKLLPDVSTILLDQLRVRRFRTRVLQLH